MFKRNLIQKEKKLISEIIKFIKEKHLTSENHDYGHIFEVTQYSIEIGKQIPQEVDPFILICGALFHDIGRIINIPAFHTLHSVEGSSVVNEFLDIKGVEKAKINKIREIVLTHSATAFIKPKTIESKIVYDADAIDRLGYVGIFRGVMHKRGSTEDILNTLIKKRNKIYKQLNFSISKKIANNLQKQTIELLSKLNTELKKRHRHIQVKKINKLIKKL